MRLIKAAIVLIIVAMLPHLSHAQWERRPFTPSGHIYDIVVTDNAIYLAFSRLGVYKSADGAATWMPLNYGLPTTEAKTVHQILPLNGNLFAATRSGIYKLAAGSDTWVKKSNGITIGPGSLYEDTEAIFYDNGVLYTGAWNGIYRSTDNGESWQITNVSGQSVGPRFFIKHNGIFFAARENINFPDGYISTDNGTTWNELSSIMLPTITFLSESGKLWTGTIGGVYLSEDNGDSWEPRFEGLGLDPYNSSIIRVNGALVSSVKFGGSGIYYSTNDGNLWMDFGEGLDFLSVIDKLMVYGDKILTATSDGLWQRNVSDLMTGITNNDPAQPTRFELAQNYPNPFNVGTSIEFSLPEAGQVMIKAYDITGREVGTIFDSYRQAGYHTANWNAAELASGTYFYKLTAGDYSAVKKLVLMK